MTDHNLAMHTMGTVEYGAFIASLSPLDRVRLAQDEHVHTLLYGAPSVRTEADHRALVEIGAHYLRAVIRVYHDEARAHG